MFSQISYIIISDPLVLVVQKEGTEGSECKVQKEAQVYMPNALFEWFLRFPKYGE